MSCETQHLLTNNNPSWFLQNWKCSMHSNIEMKIWLAFLSLFVLCLLSKASAGWVKKRTDLPQKRQRNIETTPFGQQSCKPFPKRKGLLLAPLGFSLPVNGQILWAERLSASVILPHLRACLGARTHVSLCRFSALGPWEVGWCFLRHTLLWKEPGWLGEPQRTTLLSGWHGFGGIGIAQ